MNNEGCFKTCTNCLSEINCCSHFDIINSPVLNKEELLKIKQFIKKDNFYNILGDNLFSLKIQNSTCVFYVNNKCTIYEVRPVDCKLYPFDVIKLEDKYYLILYLLNCINHQLFKKESLNIESLINELKPWIDDFTDERNFTKMKKKQYQLIKEIKL